MVGIKMLLETDLERHGVRWLEIERKPRQDLGFIIIIELEGIGGGSAAKIDEIQVKIKRQTGIEYVLNMVGITGEIVSSAATAGTCLESHAVRHLEAAWIKEGIDPAVGKGIQIGLGQLKPCLYGN